MTYMGVESKKRVYMCIYKIVIHFSVQQKTNSIVNQPYANKNYF